MDVRLSPEQRALRDSAVQVVDRLAPPSVGALDDAERAAKLDAAVAATGWRELRNAFDGDEPMASVVEVAIVAEELGRGLADVAFLGPTLAAELRRRAAAPAATTAETVALTPDLSAVAAEADGAVAIDALGATDALVLVPQGDGHRLGSVLVTGETGRFDLTRPSVVLDRTAPVELVADQGRALDGDALTSITALGLSVTGADLVGTMAGAVQLATGYAAERRQYGVAVGSFQAVQHLLADAFVLTEGSRSVALHAAWAADALPAHEALAAAAVAKAYCARSARAVCETAIQVHGGIGNTWECLAHVHLRRALLSSDVLGGVGPSLSRVLQHHHLVGARAPHGRGGDRGLR
jgi:alkylation response protein AidB-like acyl-CoA dehydrogenase